MRSIFKGETLILNNLPKSLGYLAKPGFKRFFFMPTIIATCIGVLMIIAGFMVLPKYFFLLHRLLIDLIPASLNFLGKWIALLVTFATVSFFIAFFLISLKYIVLMLMAPVMGILTEKVYQNESFPIIQTPLANRIFRSIKLNIRLIISEIFITLLFLTVCFFTGTSIFLPFILFVVQSYFAGCSLIDLSLELNGYSYKNSKLFFSSNKFFCFGTGAVFMLLFAIPLIGIAAACFIGSINSALSFHHYQSLQENSIPAFND